MCYLHCVLLFPTISKFSLVYDFLLLFLLVSLGFCFVLFVLFETRSHVLSPKLECSGTVTAHCSLHLPGLSNPFTSAFQVTGTTGVYHYTWLFFVFSVEMGSLHVPRADLQNPRLSWSSCLGLPKCWDYRCELLCLANSVVFLAHMCSCWCFCSDLLFFHY